MPWYAVRGKNREKIVCLVCNGDNVIVGDHTGISGPTITIERVPVTCFNKPKKGEKPCSKYLQADTRDFPQGTEFIQELPRQS